MADFTPFSLSNPTFANFAFYGIISVFKLFSVAFLTGYYRGKNKVISSPEDTLFIGAKKNSVKPVYDDREVERTRRNHLNDLENIPAFLFVGLLYVCTNPTPQVALWHFRVFALSRIAHTFCFQMGLQPWRAIFHMCSLFSTISMAAQTFMSVL